MRTLLAVCLLAVCSGANAQRQLDDDQSKLVEAARTEALSYSSSLPDFLCTEIIKRQVDPRSDNRWRAIDTLTVRLSYSDHRENYKLVAVNGKPTLLDYLFVGGALTTGEFGSRLIALFMAESKAVFEWKGWAQIHGRRTAVLHYRIAKENSAFRLQFGEVPVGPNSIVVGYRGEVSIDETTHRVLRLTAQAEIPAGFPIQDNTSTVEYGFQEVGGREFLLPVRADSTTKSGRYTARNDTQFREYRKFHSEATITFDTPEEKPKTPPDKK